MNKKENMTMNKKENRVAVPMPKARVFKHEETNKMSNLARYMNTNVRYRVKLSVMKT